MSAYNEAVDCLKQMHSIVRKHNKPAYDIDRKSYMSLDADTRAELERNIRFMREEGWITPYTLCVGLPVSYALTSLGIKVAEDIIEPAVIQQTNYHIGSAQNSVIGDNAHNNTINVGASFEELKQLIEGNISSHTERNEILKVIQDLQNNMALNKPLEKGILARINDKLEGCSWLSSGVTALILQYLTNR